MKTHARRLGGALATIWLLAAGACSDPAGLDRHGNAEGVAIRLNSQVVASYDGASRRWTGELTVAAGRSTGLLTVEFLDRSGAAIATGSGFYLGVDMGNPNVAAFQPTTPGAFTGTIEGKTAGQTTAVFKLMHGSVGRGHSDFTTAPATVRVTG